MIIKVIVALAFAISMGVVAVDAHPHNGSTSMISLGDGIGIERTELVLSVPSDNTMPWAYVEGIVDNPVDGYPVIIQIRTAQDEPVHFAQTDVGEDGAYEYRFRVYGLDGEDVVRAFDGAYDVTVYKVVHIEQTYV